MWKRNVGVECERRSRSQGRGAGGSGIAVEKQGNEGEQFIQRLDLEDGLREQTTLPVS